MNGYNTAQERKDTMPRVYFGFDAQSVPGEHIFLSYSRTDTERVKGIALELHKLGLPIWYDDGLIPGNIWEDEIYDNVTQSRITIFLLTKELFRRDKSFMQNEFECAVDFRKSALCIWLDDLGNMDCSQLSREMYKWWKKLEKLHSIEVYHLHSDKQKADEIFRGLCRADRKFTQYAPKPESKPISNPAPQPVKQTQPTKPPPPPAPRKTYRVGDRIPFGQYPQGANGEVQPLMWRVLAVENGRALLITDKLIDCVRYNEVKTDVTWKTCTLRKWMNDDFISKAFNSSQQAQIVTVTNPNADNPTYGTRGGNATRDRIFALSIDEAEKYFRDEDDRMAAVTEYAKKQGAYICDDKTAKKYGWKNSLPTGEKTGWWWLRSPGDSGGIAAGVVTRGFVLQCGGGVSFDSGAVRPAFWLNL